MIIQKIFNKGLITQIEDRDTARGSASDCLNWHTLGDKIELRRGRKLLGEENVDAGRVSGLRVGRRFDGVEFIFFTFAQKLFLYDPVADTKTEVGSNLFPAAVLDANGLGEDISIEQYNSLAGNWLYLSSPNSSMYKVSLANPTSVVDLLQKEFRGKIRIKSSSTFLWDRKDLFGGSDKTGLYRSFIDKTELVYAYTFAEVLGTGTGAQNSFSGTLAFKAANSKETMFFPVIAAAKQASTSISAITAATEALVTSNAHGLAIGDTVVFDSIVGMTQMNGRVAVVTTVPSANTFTVNVDSTLFTAYGSGGNVSKAERFVDDRSGNLIGQDGGTGTINYATGAYVVNFNTAVPVGKEVYAQYFREDSTNQGVADFSFSAPRTIGEGFVFRQDDGGGPFMTLESLGNQEYCFHKFKTWIVTIGSPDDTEGTTNLIYRDNVGIPYHRAAQATGEGIYYPDIIGENPAIRVLNFGRFVNEVLPRSVSDQLNLNAYEFDEAVMFEWSNYIVLACKSARSSINDRLFLYHKIWKTWEPHSYRVSCLDILGGALVAGDSGSNNIFKLFSGLADEESLIENFYITNDDLLDKEGVKSVNIMRVAGDIGIDQKMRLSYSVDNEPFVEIFRKDSTDPLIEGNGPYVDISRRKLIGSLTMGEELIGGGQDPENAIYAAPYELQFRVGTKKFERIRLKFEAVGIGYLCVSEYGFVDIREKGLKLPTKYVAPI